LPPTQKKGAADRLWPAAPLNNIALERLAQCHADGSWLVGCEAEPRAATPFPVEGKQRLLVGQVIDLEDG